ncbi:MAG: hypothetical protein IJ088_07385 [Clostridia bacterium]|nr:hypothetical protein [Clostridia bacterium]
MAEDNGTIRPYQGKDIVSKILANTFGEKTFEVYGLKNVPAIKAYLPTELPVIEASYRISDYVFLLEDDSIAIVDYESAYRSINKIKYLEYATRLAKKFYTPDSRLRIRIIVVYTCDVETAEDTLELGAISLKVEQAFLSKIDGDAEYERIRKRVQAGEKLEDADLMRLVILPLTKKGTPAKIKMIDEVIETASKMQPADEAGTSFVLSAMYVALGNYITEEQEKRIKGVLDMTSLGKRYEQERKQYGELCMARVYTDLVNKRMQEKNITAQEACDELGIGRDTYVKAKAVIDSNQEAVAVKTAQQEV